MRRGVSEMRAFESIEIAAAGGVPNHTQVLARIRSDEPCHAEPMSKGCLHKAGRDGYAASTRSSSALCEQYPRYEQMLQKMTAEWEEWVLNMQDMYT